MGLSRGDIFLKRISDILISDLSLIDNISLYNGKAGIALFLFRYARYSRNSLYEEYAHTLIDEIAENVHNEHSPGFLNGVTGIGWGIEYLVQNGFIDSDTDEALFELDEAIYAARLQRFVIDKGNDDVFGYGLYFLARLKDYEQNSNTASTVLKKHVLIFLLDECEKILIHNQGIAVLHPNGLASIAYFLLEMQKRHLCGEKAGLLLHVLSGQFEAAMRSDDRVDNLNEYCKAAFFSLLYAPYYTNNKSGFLEGILHSLAEEEGWKCFVQDSGNYNLSFNGGMAGIGLALLSSMEA